MNNGVSSLNSFVKNECVVHIRFVGFCGLRFCFYAVRMSIYVSDLVKMIHDLGKSSMIWERHSISSLVSCNLFNYILLIECGICVSQGRGRWWVLELSVGITGQGTRFISRSRCRRTWTTTWTTILANRRRRGGSPWIKSSFWREVSRWRTNLSRRGNSSWQMSSACSLVRLQCGSRTAGLVARPSIWRQNTRHCIRATRAWKRTMITSSRRMRS